MMTNEAISRQITIIVSTSPIPSHPSTAIISRSLSSLRAQLPCSRIVIMADGPSPAIDPYPYDRYLSALREQWSDRNCSLFHFSHVHQSGMLGPTLDLISTPYLLYWEHDWLLCPDIPWPDLAALIGRGDFNSIKLHANPRVSPFYEHMMLERVMYQDGIASDRHTDQRGEPILAFIKTLQWSQNPHLASTSFYRDRILPLVDGKHDFIENLIHGIVANTPWDYFRTAIYNPVNGDMMRIMHLDGKHTRLSAPELSA